MFKHEQSGPCKLRNCTRKMCAFAHKQVEIEEVTENLEDIVHGTSTQIDDEIEYPQCGCTFVDEVELDWHMQASHMSG